MQPTLKMSDVQVRRLLAVERARGESELGRRETVPAISGVRVRSAAAVVVDGSRDGATTLRPASLDRREESVDVCVELEPIFDAHEMRIAGQEARTVRPHQPVTIGASERGEPEGSQGLRRRGRELAAESFVRASSGSKLFVDVLAVDLLDPQLYVPDAPLSRIADRVILQLRGRLDEIPSEDLRARISVLRFQGYRLAVADIDTAPGRLSLIAEVAPEYLKLDPSIVRGIDTSDTNKRIASGITTMCRLLGTTPVAEGVTTAKERTALVEAGCHLVQGPLHRPDDEFALPVRKCAGVGPRRR